MVLTRKKLNIIHVFFKSVGCKGKQNKFYKFCKQKRKEFKKWIFRSLKDFLQVSLSLNFEYYKDITWFMRHILTLNLCEIRDHMSLLHLKMSKVGMHLVFLVVYYYQIMIIDFLWFIPTHSAIFLIFCFT